MESEKKYDVEVIAQSLFFADQSDEESDNYVFTYAIKITNKGTLPAQLLSRHWIITDATGEVQEVRGIGVIGKQPALKPGESFEYSSGTSIPTPAGTMRGTYKMVAIDGTKFDAQIPEFTLSMPRILH